MKETGDGNVKAVCPCEPTSGILTEHRNIMTSACKVLHRFKYEKNCGNWTGIGWYVDREIGRTVRDATPTDICRNLLQLLLVSSSVSSVGCWLPSIDTSAITA